jgi:hypothetical protein
MPIRIENIEPRRQLLDVWEAASEYLAAADHKWTWRSRFTPNSINDAEQLLVFLQPATAVAEFDLTQPGRTAEDCRSALAAFGDSVQVPRVLMNALTEFLDTYTSKDGTPDFSGGSRVAALESTSKLSADQRALDITASYTTSVSLCLAALTFIDGYSQNVKGAWIGRLADLRTRVSRRLTAALVGLLRGFTMVTVEQDSEEGAILLRMLGADGPDDYRRVINQFNERMQLVRGRLGQARLGVARAEELDNDNVLFQIGWTWGIASDAPPVDLADMPEGVGAQREGYALSAPYLYFTLMATDAIELLTSERVRVAGVLDPVQDRLAGLLGTRRDLTQIYWSRLARFTEAAWPIEDLPWRTIDGEESDYYSLLVSAVLVQDLRQRTASEHDLQRVEPLLAELASRARITRRPLREDRALDMHIAPGFLVELETAADMGTAMVWQTTDFAPVLLKRANQLAELTNDPEARDRLLSLAVSLWNHLRNRRIPDGGATGLWDDPAALYGVGKQQTDPVWSVTARVVDALVSASSALLNRSARTPLLVDVAAAMCSEAEYLLNQLQMSTPAVNSPLHASLRRIRDSVQRGKSMINSQPGTTIALCAAAMAELDSAAQSRADGSQGV